MEGSSKANIPVVQHALFDDVLELQDSTRLLAAKTSLDSLRSSLSEHPNEVLSEKLLEHSARLELLITREAESREVLSMGTVDDSWSDAGVFFGTHTHYKLTEGGTILVRLEGEMENLPLFEQLAVIHEVEFFKDWIPFCFTSRTVEKLGPAELIAHFGVSVPPFTRDALLTAYGVDCLLEEGKILFIGKSIEDWPLPSDTDKDNKIPVENVEGSSKSANNSNKNRSRSGTDADTDGVETIDLTTQPWKKQASWFHDRMIIKDFKSMIQILGPNTAKTIVVARVDPKLPLPQPFINFIMKNVAGVFLNLFQRQVLKVHAHPEGPTGERIRGNRAFYEGWVLTKIRKLCEQRNWPPPTVGSLGIHQSDESEDTANKNLVTVSS